MNRQPAIRCENVEKTYRIYDSRIDMALDKFGFNSVLRWKRSGKPKEFTALKNVHLTVEKGERIGIVGRNGAGKTTLLRLINGAASNSIQPTVGKISVDGEVYALMGIESANPNMSGRENARAALVNHGLSGDRLQEALDDVATFVDLGQFIDQPFQTYSLGMGMRLNFAIATALSPEIILIDEVLGAGDIQFAKKAAARMRKLIFSGCTSILVSHSLELIEEFCDRVIWLRDGQIAGDGPASEVLSSYSTFAAASDGASKAFEWRRMEPVRPPYIGGAFVARALSEAEGRPPDAISPSAFDGQQVRNPEASSGNPRILNAELFATSDSDRVLHVGHPLRLEVDVNTGNSCSDFLCAFELYTLDGKRIARFVGEETRGRAGSIVISLDISELYLGGREYLGTIALLDPAHPESLSNAFDLASGAIYAPVSSSNDIDPPIIHHPAFWKFGNSEKPVKARIGSSI